jgi:hypothetical protein
VRLEAQGRVALSDHSLVDVGGTAPGSVSIRGGQVVVEQGSRVLAENESAVATDSSAPGPGAIAIEANDAVLVDDGLLSVSTSNAGNAGTLHLKGPTVEFRNGPGTSPHQGSWVTLAGARAETTAAGAAGEIRIDANELAVRNGAAVSTQAFGPDAGDAGVIRIAARTLRVEGSAAWSRISAASMAGPGAPGRIEVEAGSVEVSHQEGGATARRRGDRRHRGRTHRRPGQRREPGLQPVDHRPVLRRRRRRRHGPARDRLAPPSRRGRGFGARRPERARQRGTRRDRR